MNGILLSLALLVQGQVAQVEVQETQLPAYNSTLVGIEVARVLLKQGDNQRAVPFDQLLRLKFKDETNFGNSPPSPPGLIEVQLIDGSQFTATQFTYDGKVAGLQLDDQRMLDLPVAMISNCVLQPLNEAQRTGWQAVAASRISTDQLVVIRSPEAVDTIEGVISGIDANGVKFEFDGQSIVAPLAKLAGLRFFTKAATATSGRLLAVARDNRGSSWMVSRIESSNQSAEGEVQIELACGSEVRLPLTTLTEIDFSFGSMRFLAELPPLNRSSPSRFALKLNLTEASELFGAQFLPPESGGGAVSGPGLQFLGSGSIVYRVPEGFRRLLGSVELSPDGPFYVPCRVALWLEDKVLWEKQLTETRRPDSLELQVEGGKRLKIEVKSTGSSPVGDLVLLKQLRFVK